MPIINPQVDLRDSFPHTNLDLQDNDPINVGQYNHQQVYTPNSTYETYLNEQGLKKGSKLYTNGFDKNYTGRGYVNDQDLIETWDSESEEATYKPVRPEVLGGKSSNLIKSTRNGRAIQKQVTHTYTPNNPYNNPGAPIIPPQDDINPNNTPTGAKNQL